MKVIPLDEAEKALAEQMAYEARMEFGGRHKAEDYLLIAKAHFQNCPIIEAEPVRRGRWIDNKCSLCGQHKLIYKVVRRGETVWETEKAYLYCPNCGALMEEGEERWNK